VSPSTPLRTGIAAAEGRDFLALSRRLLDVLGPDGLGDESDQRQFAVDGIEPSWVLLPASIAEAETALRLCAAHDLAIVPAGRGLRLGRGLAPERLDAVLSTSAMSAIVDHAAADLTLTVEAGATLATVNETLRPAGQWLPFDPALPQETTIGGLIAAQAAGPSRQAFGTARESLLGVRALLADGTLVKSGGRVVKNVAGYDIHKLLVGSFGTLAVIAEATFKLQPLPEAKHIVSYGSAPLASLFDLARMLADSALGVQFLEVLAGTSSDPMLVAGFAGVAEDVDEASRRAAAYATDLGIDAREPFDEALLWKRLDEFERVPSQAVVVRAGMLRTELRSWVSVSLEQCAAIAGRVRAHAHGGLGVARLRLDEVDPQRLEPVLANLRQTARRSGGYLIIEHAQAPWKRSLDVWGPPPADHHLMKGIKAAFDPHRRLAPGRFVGGL
jgi:glycolate oxidase FAD binding subunit